MNILGLSGGIKIGNQDGAAALLVDGQLVAAAEEERFLGIKFANGQLPRNAIVFCLDRAGLSVEDLDAVVFAGATYERFEEILADYFAFQFGHASLREVRVSSSARRVLKLYIPVLCPSLQWMRRA